MKILYLKIKRKNHLKSQLEELKMLSLIFKMKMHLKMEDRQSKNKETL